MTDPDSRHSNSQKWVPADYQLDKTDRGWRAENPDLIVELERPADSGTQANSPQTWSLSVQIQGATSTTMSADTAVPENIELPETIARAWLGTLVWGLVAYGERFQHLDQQDLELIAQLTPGDPTTTERLEEQGTSLEAVRAFQWLLDHQPDRAAQWVGRMNQSLKSKLDQRGLIEKLRQQTRKKKNPDRDTTPTGKTR